MAVTQTRDGEIPTLGIGMLGYAFMGKAHSNALKTLDYIYTPPPAHPSLVAIGGSNRQQVEAAASRYGYGRGVTNWRDIVAAAIAQSRGPTIRESGGLLPGDGRFARNGGPLVALARPSRTRRLVIACLLASPPRARGRADRLAARMPA